MLYICAISSYQHSISQASKLASKISRGLVVLVVTCLVETLMLVANVKFLSFKLASRENPSFSLDTAPRRVNPLYP